MITVNQYLVGSMIQDLEAHHGASQCCHQASICSVQTRGAAQDVVTSAGGNLSSHRGVVLAPEEGVQDETYQDAWTWADAAALTRDAHWPNERAARRNPRGGGCVGDTGREWKRSWNSGQCQQHDPEMSTPARIDDVIAKLTLIVAAFDAKHSESSRGHALRPFAWGAM